MINHSKKILVWMILACFSFVALPAATAFAKKDHNKYDHKQDKRYKKYDKRHDRVVINVIRIEDRHLGFARKNRLTLRDIIIAKTIADESRHLDTEDVLRMKLQGKSYKNIARQYNINWRTVDRKLDDIHRAMKHEAIKQGLTLWALDELLD